MPAGDQPFTVSGVVVAGVPTASATGIVHVLAGQIVEVTVDLTSQTVGGDVTFQWSFDSGKTCSDVGSAAKVTVSIAGQMATFDCNGPNGQSGTVTHIVPGQSAFTIVAAATAGGPAFAQGSGQVLVTRAQNTPFPVILHVIDAASVGRVLLSWSFSVPNGNGPGCAGARVDRVSVQIGNGVPLSVPCLDFVTPGQRMVVVPNVPAGSTSILLTTVGSTISSYAWSNGVPSTVTVMAQQDNMFPFTLGGMSLNGSLNDVQFHWTFAGKTCAQAGVSQITVNLPAVGILQAPCNAAGTFRPPNSFAAANLPFTLSATGTGGIVYGAAGTFTTEAHGSTTDVHVDLQASPATTGTGSVALDLAFSPAEVDCAAAGLDHVHLFLADAKDALVAGSDTTVNCGALPVTLSSIPSGSYYLNVQGSMADGTAPYVMEIYNLTVTPAATSSYRIAVH